MLIFDAVSAKHWSLATLSRNADLYPHLTSCIPSKAVAAPRDTHPETTRDVTPRDGNVTPS
jgi:hypothetical protein